MFRLNFSCRNCNPIRLEQVINYINEAWNCIENGSIHDENRFFEENGDECHDIAVDTVFYWDGKNTAEIQQYINSNFDKGKETIAIIDHPKYEDEGYEYIDSYPLIAPDNCRWQYTCVAGSFRVLHNAPKILGL